MYIGRVDVLAFGFIGGVFVGVGFEVTRGFTGVSLVVDIGITIGDVDCIGFEVTCVFPGGRLVGPTNADVDGVGFGVN